MNTPPEMVVRSWTLPDMHCAHCVKSIENLPQHLDGVWRAEVNFPQKSVRVEYDANRVEPSSIETVLRSMGFPPLPPQVHSNASMRALVGRLAVAGFAFGNVMMMSLADYVGGASFLESGFVAGFKLWSMVLAIPVVAYSAAPFFRRAWAGIRKRRLNLDVPVALGIVTLATQSVTMEGLGYFDSLTGLVFFLLLGQWYQSRSQTRLLRNKGLEEWLPLFVTNVTKTGEAKLVPIAELSPGMRIRMHHGEVIPADGVLSGSRDAILDRAFLNGESLPQTVCPGSPLSAGERNAGQALEMIVTRRVDQSDLMRMWHSEAFQKDLRSSLSSPIDAVAQHFTWAVLTLAVLGWFLWWPQSAMAWNVFAAVLIVACPCALALSIPFAYGAAARHLGQLGFFLKHSEVLERFAQINHVVFDKTGTLTTSDRFSLTWLPLEEPDPEALSAALTLSQQSAHPISRALVEWGNRRGTQQELTDFEEIHGHGLVGRVGRHTWALGSASFTGLEDPDGAPGTWIHLTCDAQLRGQFFLSRPLRPGMEHQLQALRDAGYTLHLLSGDGPAEAQRFETWFGRENMHFRQTPQAKMTFVELLQHEGVAMVGDGLNDAGALRTATLGLAVADELYAFTPSADALVDAPHLTNLLHAMTLAKKARTTVKVLLGISAAYNVVGLAFALQGWLTPLVAAVLMPASSLTVVTVALGRSRRAFAKLTEVSLRKHIA
jgi:P-type Cu+ transporter